MLASSAGRSSRSTVGQPGRIDRRQPAREPAQVADLPFDGLTAPVLQQVVVEVDTVERGVGGMDLVEIREILVDEVRQWFG